MGFWALNEKQVEALKREIKGALVYDIGCGDGSLALWMLRNGARKVIGLDHRLEEQAHRVIDLGLKRLELRQGSLEASDPIKADVGLLSWPFNMEHLDFVRHIKRSRTIIFIGQVFDGSCCGNPELFKYLSTRKLSKRIAGRRNSLLVYRNRAEKRLYCPEENAGWDWDAVHPHPDSLYPMDLVDCNSVI